MKTKKLYLLASALMFAFASCTNDTQELESEQSQLLKQIVMTTEDFEPETGSRTLYDIADGAVKCTWASNDTVGVFPDKGIQTAFPMASGAGTKNATFDGGGWALKDGSTYGAYYPCIGDFYLDKHAVPVSYAGQTQTGNASTEHLGACDYMVSAPTAPEFGSAQFMFKHLSALVQLRLTIPQPTTVTSVKLVAETKAFALEGKVDIMADVPSITPVASANELELTLQEVSTTEENQAITLYMMLPPVDLSGQSLKAVVSSDKDVQEIALESKNFEAGKAYGLSGEMEAEKGSYENGVVTLSEAGTMKELLGDDWLNITSLKVVGPINGDDVYTLREMLGGHEIQQFRWGNLTTLDLSEATIVGGGKSYYQYSSYSYGTSNNIIGPRMFYWCEKLQTIVLPNNVTSISIEAIYNCNNLSSVTIGNSVTSIGTEAFRGCDMLVSINIPNSVTSIGKFAFANCSSLKNIELSSSVTTIKEGTFNGCSSLTSIAIPGVTSIGLNAFSECSALPFIPLPKVSSIGEYAFSYCSSLGSIALADCLTSIGRSAFSYCKSLQSIIIPDGVTSIGSFTFSGCESLNQIFMSDKITSIGYGAFSGCSSLTHIDIPESVTSIGEKAFSSCEALKSVYITDLSAWCNITFNTPDSNPLSNGAKLYLNDNELTKLVIQEGIAEIKKYAFEGCQSLTEVVMGGSVKTINNGAFRSCGALTSVIMGDSVTSLGEEAFYSCDSLTYVTIGKGITSVGDWAFRGCFALTEFYCQATTPPEMDVYLENYFGYKTTLYVPKGCSSKYRASNWGTNFQVIMEMN